MSVSAAISKFLMIKKLRINPQSVNTIRHITQHHSLITSNDSRNVCEVLQPVQEDLSDITPNFHQSFNIAAYVNRSETLQNLVKLNVNLTQLEKKPYIVEKFLKLDFDRDMKTHIIFLTDYIDLEQIGDYITKNPMIFYEDLKDLKVRINYLNSKGFQESQIKRIIRINPHWLMFSTVRIDRRFGYFQESFELAGEDVRSLATKQPKLITYNLHHIKTNMFSIKEEMGFESNEIKTIILNKPKILMLNHRALLERFNYIHNVMQISHKTIVTNPEVLLSRLFRIKQRHLFLKKLGRNQYDPKQENFIPITALIKDTDVEFCKKYAKCNIGDYNLFLKTV